MGKSRFTTLDVAAVAAALRERAVGLRVVNVYDAPGTNKV
jgi:predicted ribosome quality control (RQC) complex YloA/Tae2 family protein